MHGEEQVVHASAAEEILIRVIEGFLWGIEGEREQVFFALQCAAIAIIRLGCFFGAAIAVAQRAAHSGCVDFVHVFLEAPGHAHPVNRGLQQDDVCPLVVFQLLVHVPAFIDFHDFCLMPVGSKQLVGHLNQSSVEFAFCEGIVMVRIDDEDIAHRNLHLW